MTRILTVIIMLLAATFPVFAQSAPSSEVLKDLAPTGKVRAAINFGNPVLAQKGPNGEPQGVSAELAAALAKRLGVPVEYMIYASAGNTFAGAKENAWDVAFIAIEPLRAGDVEFSSPYVLIQGTYLVHKDSPLKDVGDVDKPGIKIGVGQGSVYDLFLTRTLKSAALIRNPKGGAAGGVEPFLEQNLDAAAGVREALDTYVKAHPDMRVMAGSFQDIRQAMATPKGRLTGVAYLRGFVEEMKANGFVADALKRSGQSAPVAPPGD
jgi:polar amino acid transport system substrate-binding protein